MCDQNYIPEGFQTISPYFCVNNASGFLIFLEKAFGGETVYTHHGKDNTILYSRVKIGTSLLEVSDANASHPARQFACQVFVPDCDKVFQQALAAGASAVSEPMDMVYGLRSGFIKDPWGNQWYLSTQINNRYSPAFWEHQ